MHDPRKWAFCWCLSGALVYLHFKFNRRTAIPEALQVTAVAVLVPAATHLD